MTSAIRELFVGAAAADAGTIFDYDDSLYAAAETFAGADRDILLGGEASDGLLAEEGFLGAADDSDAVTVAEETFELAVDLEDFGFDDDRELGEAVSDVVFGD